MKVRPFLILASALAVFGAAAGPASAAKVCAWSVPSEMVDSVRSSDTEAGRPFRFRVTQTVPLDDGTKIPAGTIGYGIVRGASAAGRRNHDGMIALEPRYLLVPKPHGEPRTVPVTMNPTLPVVWTPTEPLLNKAASHIPNPIPGLVMTGVNIVRWGRNITLGPGFAFSVLPVENLARGPVC